MLMTFIAALDQTIVATALPRIVADLQVFDLIVWVTTLFLLTSTVTIPLYGKLSDLFGRKTIFMVALVFFRQLGQSIGLAALGAVVTTSYIPAFSAALPAELKQHMPSRLLAIFENLLVLLSPDILTPIRASFAHAGAQGLATFDQEALPTFQRCALCWACHMAAYRPPRASS
ncbi:MFS transporter [Ktedonosporobacter rubrisoli]|uniref:MFS transporter n=2 Tax=Ktedonosporobacter rubrisoli TaxID=2509675 RepID=A0A4P6K553_KTERU|nr:MFS transporter [Ktedonosporobacter rubrisoli]